MPTLEDVLSRSPQLSLSGAAGSEQIDVDADEAGTAATLDAAHVAASNPHTQYARATTAALDIYASPSGDDANDGLTALTPVLTAERVDALIPPVVSHLVRVHLVAGTITCNTRNWFLSSRVFRGGRIHVYADAVLDPAVYTVRASGTCAAGTGATKIVTAGGYTVDAHSGYTMELTSGGCAGQKRTIRNNTATDFHPVDRFDPMWTVADPAPGDAYRITSNACVISSTSTNFTLVQPCAGASRFNGSHVQFRGVTVAGPLNGTLTIGGVVRLVGVQTALRVDFTDEASVGAGDGDAYFDADDTANDYNTTGWNETLGWGLTTFYNGSAGPVQGYDWAPGHSFFGYLHAAGGPNTVSAAIRGELYGGRVKTLSRCRCETIYGSYWSSSADTALQVDRDAILGVSGSYPYPTPPVYLSGVSFAGTLSSPRLQVGAGAVAYVTSSVTGESSTGNTAIAKWGGRILFNGAPALGRSSGDDIAADSTLAQNKSQFSAAEANTMHGEMGSVVARIV